MAQTDRNAGLVAEAGVKNPVNAATTANITLSGEQTVDGVALVADDRCLVKDQTDDTENGIYEVSTGSWTRAKDFNGAYDVKKGSIIFVNSGTTNSQTLWAVTSSDDPTFGTSSITFAGLQPVIGGANTWTGGQTWQGAQTFEGAITSSGANTWTGTQDFQGAISSSGVNTWTGTQTFSAALDINAAITVGAITSTGMVSIQTTAPQVAFKETDASANNQDWDIIAFSESFRMRAGANEAWVIVEQTTGTIDSVEFRNGNIAAGPITAITTASKGFFYIPTSTATPTGTPTAFANRVPMVFDDANDVFWIYAGGRWVGTTLSS